MTAEKTGLRTWLYTYGLDEAETYRRDKKQCGKDGSVSVVFIQDGYAFEYTPGRAVFDESAKMCYNTVKGNHLPCENGVTREAAVL